MLGQRGSIHTIVFGLVLLFGFVAALGWPQYAKHREISRAKEALFSARNMAQAQSTYAAAHNGQYAGLCLWFPCPTHMIHSCAIVPTGVRLYFFARYTLEVPTKEECG